MFWSPTDHWVMSCPTGSPMGHCRTKNEISLQINDRAYIILFSEKYLSQVHKQDFLSVDFFNSFFKKNKQEKPEKPEKTNKKDLPQEQWNTHLTFISLIRSTSTY